MKVRRAVLLGCLSLVVFLSSAHAIQFSGRADNDFPAIACFNDPNGLSVGIPAGFPVGTISGFDLESLCFLYNVPQDTLFVGLQTFENLGVPLIFGDADGDGNAGGTSAVLASRSGTDFPNLSVREYSSLVVDFDATAANLGVAPEVVAGVSVGRELPGGFRVSEVASPLLDIDFAFSGSYYGNLISSSSGSAVFVSPSIGAPHLEFTIRGFSALPGFASLSLSNPDETIGFIVKDGSLGDDGIGDEDIRVILNLQDITDNDGDDVPNSSDLDKDNDGISDITEQNLDPFDTNGNCQIDAAEAAASGRDLDADGDIDTNDGLTLVDTDSDGTPDFLDTDTDSDLIFDLDEANTFLFDTDGSRSISPSEFLTIDLGGNFAGGNNDGCLHNGELPDTDNDGTPDYRDRDSDNDTINDIDEAGDGTTVTPPVDTDGDTTPDFRDPDSDNDNLPDDDEGDIGTSPTDPDSDDDGVLDGDEVNQGDDPLFPGAGLDPDINVPNSGQAVQVQGSGFSCALVKESPESSAAVILAIFSPLFLLLLRKRRFLISVAILGMLVSSKAQALNIEQFRPNFDNLGLINLQDHRTLQRRAWSLGVGLSFAKDPLELALVGGGNAVDNLVDYHVNTTINLAYGIDDWVTVGLIVPFFPNLSIEPIGSGVSQSTAAFGDVGLAAKMSIWEQGDPEDDDIFMGVAVSPFIFFPSGSTGKFTGDSSVTGGLRGAYDITLWKNKLVANLGMRFREKEAIVPNLTVGQELLFGVGYTRPLLERYDLHGLTELNGSTSLNGFGTRQNRTPLEWLFGLRKGFRESRVQATAGASLGMTAGYGTPDYRIFGMLTYVAPPIPKRERKTKIIEKTVEIHTYAKVEGGQIRIMEPIHFETAKWVIKKESLPIVKDVADLMKSQQHIRLVLVEGHTDHRGSDNYNLNLSKNRAKAVRDKLIEYGVQSDRLDSAGRGEFQPIDSNKTAEGMAKNRRVEFHIKAIQEIKKTEEVTEKKEKIIKR